MTRGVLFDLDDTLVDTSALRALRSARKWKDAVCRLGETAPFPGVPELLAELLARTIPCAVITTSVSYYASHVLKHHNLSPVTVIAWHDATPKPDPAGVRLALSRIGVQPGEAIGVGDADTDLLAYRRAGVVAIGAGWSPAITRCEWDELLRTPQDLLARIDA